VSVGPITASSEDEPGGAEAADELHLEVDVERSNKSGILHRRPDHYMTRTPMTVDEQGWRELTDLHSRMMHEGFEIQARSQRLQESGEPGIPARSVQLAFEMPPAAPSTEEDGGENDG
jgi:hypothetical protein